MNRKQRDDLEALLKSLPKGEQDRLFREAKAMRAEDQKRRKAERRRYEDLDAPRPSVSKRRGDPVREYALKILAREQAARGGREDGGADRSGSHTEQRTGVAVFVGKRRCLVRPGGVAGDGADDVECLLPPELAGRQQAGLCVGDRVSYEVSSDERRGANQLTQVLPRRTVLTRRDPRTGEARAIVANVDAVVVVVSVVSPPLHPRLIDRYLIAIEDSWVESSSGSHADDPDPARAILAVNKTDLLATLPAAERDAELAKLEHLDQLLALWEWRTGPTPWAFLTVKARGSA